MMNNEKEFLLNELKEHIVDSDCAKAQHFYEEKKIRRIEKGFNILKSIVFLVTIATYILIVSEIELNDWFNKISILLTLISTLLEILSYMFRFEENAMNHWKAAQMYSEIYRKCQFFCSMYGSHSLDIWREKLNDISEELSRISLLSPSLSQKSYDDWKKNNDKKKYPVDKAIFDLKVGEVDKIVNIIKETLSQYKIEIFLFGSYISSMYYKDIDIAIIVHDKLNGNYSLEEIENKIEEQYHVNEIILDITIISEDDIIANRCTQFVKNICEGICYYRSPEVKKSITDYDGVLCNYSDMIDYFINHAENHKNDYRVFVMDVFYMYYHALTAFLSLLNISWYGEQSMISECMKLLTNEENLKIIGMKAGEFNDLLRHVRIFYREKNLVYLKPHTFESENLISYFNNDIESVRKIKKAYDKRN